MAHELDGGPRGEALPQRFWYEVTAEEDPLEVTERSAELEELFERLSTP